MALEIERKYPGVNLRETAERLKILGAVSLGQRFETNLVFDYPDRSLYKSGRLLRLRLNEWPNRSECVLTVKAPAKNADDTIKVREELETVTGDFAATRAILEKLGYEVVAIYEKAREEWRLSFGPGEADVALDRTPFCEAVEIEAEKRDIEKAAAALGLDKSAGASNTYHDLHREWLRERGLPPVLGFEFEPGERERLRREIGL